MRKQTLEASLLAALLLACRGEPSPSRAPGTSSAGAPPIVSATSNPPAPAVAPSSEPAAALAASASPPPPAASELVPSAPEPAAEPPLIGPDGAPLPQTEERPSTTSARFKRRMQLLADAIRTGDVEKAKATFFPLVAYTQVKDVQKPERDYRFRLIAHFERDIREYHRALGRDAASAELIGIDVPEDRAQWMKPGKEGNRVGYFRVLRSQLRFRLPSGQERRLELTSMISWRGEWYVVHLHGFE